jgi:hypothetical protein
MYCSQVANSFFLWHRCVTLVCSTEGFIAIPFRQYLCNSSYFSEKSISCAVTAAKPVEFFPTRVLCESCSHQDTNCLISWVAFFNLRICRRRAPQFASNKASRENEKTAASKISRRAICYLHGASRKITSIFQLPLVICSE